MRLSDLLSPESILIPLNADSKKDAVDLLVELQCRRNNIANQKELFDAVWHREMTRTTGIGHGIAIPHGKCSGCSKLSVVMAKPAKPLDFNSIDGKAVDLIILLASPPDQTGPHIEALASISRLLSKPEFHSAVIKASSAQEMYDLFTQQDP